MVGIFGARRGAPRGSEGKRNELPVDGVREVAEGPSAPWRIEMVLLSNCTSRSGQLVVC